jgi:hypothetical protein
MEHATIASLQRLRARVLALPPGNLRHMSVPEAGAICQDLFLRDPGLVFDKVRDFLLFVSLLRYNVIGVQTHLA